MNEAESSLTLRQETAVEIFFNEETRRMREAYNNNSNEPDLDYLRHQLKHMKALVTTLELPCDRLIPIRFRCFTSYIQQPDTNMNIRKSSQLTALLMDSMSYLSKNTRTVNALATFLDQQINDLDKLLEGKMEYRTHESPALE